MSQGYTTAWMVDSTTPPTHLKTSAAMLSRTTLTHPVSLAKAACNGCLECRL